MLLSTMAQESGYGSDLIEGEYGMSTEEWKAYRDNGVAVDERGAGYIQLTGRDEQKLFLEYIGKTSGPKDMGLNTAEYIALYYPLESALWYWATTGVKVTGGGKDLTAIREGADYYFDGGKVYINNNSYVLPNGWYDKRESAFGSGRNIFCGDIKYE